MDSILYFIFIIITLGLLFLLYWMAFRRPTLSFAGKKRNLTDAAKAKPVVSRLQRMARMYDYKVIAPAQLAIEGKYADLDAILVGSFGVLGVKCIGLCGEIYGSADDATWLQVTGEQRVSFTNPMQAAQADTRVIRDALFMAKLKNVPVETVCVFTNSHASLVLPRSTGHYTLRSFKQLLKNSRFTQEKRVDIAATTQAIEKWVSPAAKV